MLRAPSPAHRPPANQHSQAALKPGHLWTIRRAELGRNNIKRAVQLLSFMGGSKTGESATGLGSVTNAKPTVIPKNKKDKNKTAVFVAKKSMTLSTA